jgi:hypothetical protein
MTNKELEDKVRVVVIQELFRIVLAVIIGFLAVKFFEWLFFV